MLRLHLFGPPICYDADGHTLSGIFRSPRRLALFAYLADGQEPSVYGRDHLAAMFWPDLDVERGRRALRNALYGLRQDLGSGLIVQAGSDGLRVLAERIEVDTARFEAHLQRRELHQVLELYRGRFLEGFEPAGVSPDYHHWLDGRRASLQQQALGAVDTLVSGYVESDRPEQAINYLRFRIRIDPLDESVYRRAMEYLDRSGDRAGALTMYEALRKTLRRELELEPASETVALAEALRRPETTIGERRPSPLEVFSRPPPAVTTLLVGRDQEIADVQELLRQGQRLVTITGAGGSGKTRLAIAVARREGDAFRSGTAFVELAAVRDPDDVLATVARAVGIKESETRTLADGLATVVGQRRVLLILDNFEQVIEAAADVAWLLRTCPNLHVLITSRAPLRIRAEAEYPLRPLALPPAEHPVPGPEELDRFPATRLFMERARHVVRDFAPGADDLKAIVSICRRLDGLPLALELAALRLRAYDPASLLQKLASALDFLNVGPRDGPDRQRTLRATIEWSHSLLADPERRLFRRLSVFANGATTDAAESICILPDEDPSRFAADLESLVEKGLVERLGRQSRIGFLETIREFAEERLEERGEGAAIRQAHARFYSGFAERLDREFGGPGQVQWVELAEAEEPNLEVALGWLAEQAMAGKPVAAEVGMRMCGHLWFYWHVRGKHVSTRRWARSFLELPVTKTPSEGRSLALRAAGLASWTLGDLAAAVSELEEAAQIASDRAERLVPSILFVLGVAHLSAGEADPARKRLEQSLAASRELGEPWELGMALVLTGLMEAALGDADSARNHFQEALRIQQANSDEEGAGLSLGGLAALEAAASNHDAAVELFRAALRAFEAVGDRPEEARILDGWAWSALAANRPAEARELFAQSLRAYEDVGSLRGVGLALLGLAATEVEECRPDRAIQLAAAAEVFREQEGMVNDYAEGSPAPAYIARARKSLAAGDVVRLEAVGRTRTVEDALRLALETGSPEPQRTNTSSTDTSRITQA